jgi:DNA-binding response OmpR family regulator
VSSGFTKEWKRFVSRLFRTDPTETSKKQLDANTLAPAGISLEPIRQTPLKNVIVCTPSAHLVASWIDDVAQRDYRVTVIETLTPAVERIIEASPNAILIEPGDRTEAAIQLISLLRQTDSLRSLFIGVIAHLEMHNVAKPLLEAGASRVFQPTPVRAAQILIGLKIAFTPDRFEKVPIPIVKVERPISSDSSSRQRILILEENATVAAILNEMLQDHDFAIDVAFDANTAFSLLNQTEPQAILLDILMPGLNGINVLKQIRAFEKFRRTPIIVFTSEFSTFSESHLMDAGATCVFFKARTDPAKILEVFEELLRPGEKSQSALSREASDENLGAIGEPNVETAAKPVTSQEDHVFFAEIQESLLQEAPLLMGQLRETLGNLYREASAENYSNLDRKLHAVAGNAGLARLARVGCLASATAALVEDLESKAEPLSNSVRNTLSQAVGLMGELFGRADEFMPSQTAVMAVDDEAVSRRVLAHALRKVDLRPEVFETPEEALKRALESQFELIFLDVDMPGISGFELCMEIRKLPQYVNTPVVFVTSRDSLEAFAESARSGGSDFITKPFAIRELAVKALIYLLQEHGTKQTPGQ